MEDCEPTKFLENHRDFFENFTFKFEGIPPDFKKIYEIVVQDLGARVSDHAKYIFTDFLHFELNENKNRIDLYDIRFILDSLQAEKVLNIEQYNFSLQNYLRALSNNENKTDQNDDNLNVSNNQDGSANDKSEHTQTMKDIVVNVFYKKSKNIQSKSVQNLKEPDYYQKMSIDNEDYCTNYNTDNELQISNVQSDSKIAQYLNLTIKKEDEPITLKNNDIKMEDYPNNGIYIEENSNNNLSRTSDKGNDSMLEDISQRPSTSKNMYGNNRKRTKMTSGWVDCKKIKMSFSGNVRSNTLQKNETNLTLSSSDSNVTLLSEQEDTNRDCWWRVQRKPLSENEICKKQNCTFEPDLHQKHYYPRRIISEEEKKILLRYLIINQCINKALGLKLWNNLINAGYLAHRTPESLRNCFRRSILPNITQYNLPQNILDQFLILAQRGARR